MEKNNLLKKKYPTLQEMDIVIVNCEYCGCECNKINVYQLKKIIIFDLITEIILDTLTYSWYIGRRPTHPTNKTSI